MAEKAGTADHPVIKELLEHPRRFDFYQAVRLLEGLTGGSRVGHRGRLRDEHIRIQAFPSLAFPRNEVEGVRSPDSEDAGIGGKYTITAAFMGLYGSSSPLPTAYSEFIVRNDDQYEDEDRERLQDFLDIYNHRLFSLFYRCQSKYRYHLLYELGGVDRFSGFMYSLIGRGTLGMPDDRPIPAISMVRYAGLLTHQPKSMDGVRAIVADYFAGIAVSVAPCIGRWLHVEDRNSVGMEYCALGEDTIVGGRVFDRTGKFRVSLGPVGLADFKRLLPDGNAIGELKELVRLYLLDELDFDVEIWLRGNEVPPTILGNESEPAMLGWTSWAIEDPTEDRSVIFNLR